MAQWREAPEVKEIADRLIPEHHQEIELWMDEIRYVFRDKAAKSKGRVVLGKAHKLGGMACYLIHSAPGDLNEFGDQAGDMFVVEIAEDAWETLTMRQKEALVDHELAHLSISINEEDGSIQRNIRGHSVEEFTEIIQRHGAWKPDLMEFAEALQLKMSL
jgi:hypothetical protein